MTGESDLLIEPSPPSEPALHVLDVLNLWEPLGTTRTGGKSTNRKTTEGRAWKEESPTR